MLRKDLSCGKLSESRIGRQGGLGHKAIDPLVQVRRRDLNLGRRGAKRLADATCISSWNLRSFSSNEGACLCPDVPGWCYEFPQELSRWTWVSFSISLYSIFPFFQVFCSCGKGHIIKTYSFLPYLTAQFNGTKYTYYRATPSSIPLNFSPF